MCCSEGLGPWRLGGLSFARAFSVGLIFFETTRMNKCTGLETDPLVGHGTSPSVKSFRLAAKQTTQAMVGKSPFSVLLGLLATKNGAP